MYVVGVLCAAAGQKTAARHAAATTTEICSTFGSRNRCRFLLRVLGSDVARAGVPAPQRVRLILCNVLPASRPVSPPASPVRPRIDHRSLGGALQGFPSFCECLHTFCAGYGAGNPLLSSRYSVEPQPPVRKRRPILSKVVEAAAPPSPGAAGPQSPPKSGLLARGSMSLFVSQIVGNAGFFAAALMVARGLGPAGRGTTAFITVTSLVVGRLTKVGVTESTTVFAAQ